MKSCPGYQCRSRSEASSRETEDAFCLDGGKLLAVDGGVVVLLRFMLDHRVPVGG